MTEAIGCAGVRKRYGDCVALVDASISVSRGTAHALIGENGAGKSTLMKILYGLERADAGVIRVDGAELARSTVEESIARGIGMVHQHFMLVPTLSVAENIILGREPMRGGRLDLARASRDISALAERYGLAVDPARSVGDLSVGEAQRVEILKVLYRGANVLILDEPTAMLSPPEVSPLLALLRSLVDGGATVLMVTHKLGEVLEIADEVTVLRRGVVVERRTTQGLSAETLGAALVGHAVAPTAKRTRRTEARATTFELRGVGLGHSLDDIRLALAPGEIVGIAGVEGNGQRELARIAAGLVRPSSGAVLLDGKDVTTLGIAARHRLGVAYVPDDRHEDGLLLDSAVWENMYLGRDEDFGGAAIIPERRVIAEAEQAIAAFDVRPPDPQARVRGLSGGNQQKILLARELARKPRVLVCAQPTRGVDIGAIAEIHARLLALADSGAAILLISAELDELFALADRVHVLFRGRFVAEHVLDGSDLRARIGTAMLGMA